MALSKLIRFFKRPGPIETLQAGRMGVETTPDPDLNIRMHGAKDYNGVVSKFLAKDKPTRVASIESLNREINGINTDSIGIKTGLVFDTVMYMSPTGNDSTGDGSSGSPYATIEKCFSMLPVNTPENTSVQIRVANGTYSSFNVQGVYNVPGNSQIIIDGYEGHTDVLAGPFTVDSVDTYNNYGSSYSGFKLNVAGTPFTANSMYGMHLQALTGAYAGCVWAITKNDTSSVTVNNGVQIPAIGDTFKIVDPGAVFEVSSLSSLTVHGNPRNAAIVFSNIQIKSDMENASPAGFSLNGMAGFCAFGSTISSTEDTPMCSGITAINLSNIVDYTKITYCNNVPAPFGDTDYFQYGTALSIFRNTSPLSSALIVKNAPGGAVIGYSQTIISNTVVRGHISNYSQSLELLSCSFSSMQTDVQNRSNTWVSLCMIDNDYKSFSIGAQFNSLVQIGFSTFINTVARNSTFKIDNGSRIIVMPSVTSLIDDTYAAVIGFGSFLEFAEAPAISGDTADIYFERGQVTKEFPAVGYSVTDEENSFVSVAGSVAGSVTSYEARIAALELFNTGITDGTKEFTGLTNNENITVTYNSGARTVTLSGTYKAYYKGQEIVAMENGWTSSAHAASPTSTLFLSYGESGFVWSTTPWTFNELQIAYLCFKSDGTFCFGQREVHGFMPWVTHRNIHNAIGTYRLSGGTVTFSAYGSSIPADRRPTISETVLLDEDLMSTLSQHVSGNDYTQLYLDGASGTPILTKGSTDVVALSTAQPYWNEFTGGSWQQTLMANSTYMCIWVIAIPTSSDASSQQARFVYMAGQANGTLIAMKARTTLDLDLGQFGSLSPEFSFIAKVIINYAGGDWNVHSVYPLTGSKALSTQSPSTNYLSAVSHSSYFSGSGTSSDPLDLESTVKTNVDLLQDWINGTYRGPNGFTRKIATGTFVIPSGSVAGSTSFYIDGILEDISGPPHESINYDAKIGLQVTDSYKGANSEHSGILLYGTSDTTEWEDTILGNSIESVTSIAAVNTGISGRIIFQVNWDTTNRPQALTVAYSLIVEGHIKQVSGIYS